MGSFTLTGHDKGIYEFKGLSADIGKLPKVQSIGTGSIAYCVDTGVLLMYEKTSKTWNEQ